MATSMRCSRALSSEMVQRSCKKARHSSSLSSDRMALYRVELGFFLKNLDICSLQSSFDVKLGCLLLIVAQQLVKVKRTCGGVLRDEAKSLPPPSPRIFHRI
jgi:hypothetical protein